ncbi:MAG: transcription elongation factor GreB [Bdellovibrionota bacterium]
MTKNKSNNKNEAAPNSVNLITPTGYKILMDELIQLSKVERPQVVQEVSAAAKQGDRSENAEYQYGKRRLREIDRRVRFLDKRLSIARIINPQDQKGNKILFGATVTLENAEGKKFIYQIVGEDESNLASKKISWKSPLGHALLNKMPGDIVVIEAPAGTREFEVVSFQF